MQHLSQFVFRHPIQGTFKVKIELITRKALPSGCPADASASSPSGSQSIWRKASRRRCCITRSRVIAGEVKVARKLASGNQRVIRVSDPPFQFAEKKMRSAEPPIPPL